MNNITGVSMRVLSYLHLYIEKRTNLDSRRYRFGIVDLSLSLSRRSRFSDEMSEMQFIHEEISVNCRYFICDYKSILL